MVDKKSTIDKLLLIIVNVHSIIDNVHLKMVDKMSNIDNSRLSKIPFHYTKAAKKGDYLGQKTNQKTKTKKSGEIQDVRWPMNSRSYE